MTKKENKKLNKKDKKKDELQEWKNTALRLKADYENREREIAKEKTALRGLVEENLICDFLPILDNLNSALQAVDKCAESNSAHNESWVQGVEYVQKQFEDVLRQYSIEKMELVGTEFDPLLAEAVESEGEGSKIVKVMVDGYKKDDRVIRPARVVVGE